MKQEIGHFIMGKTGVI